MKTKKIVGILLFLMGFGLVLYPMISRTYYDIHTRQETKQINTNIANDERSERLYNQQLAYNHSEITNPENIEVPEVTFIEEPVASNTEDYTDNSGNSSVESGISDNQTNFLVDENILGTISIPKIDIIYPIYDGATHENLLIGVARIEGTSYPVGGMDTNSVIAGHNGMVGKVYFSFIKEEGSVFYAAARCRNVRPDAQPYAERIRHGPVLWIGRLSSACDGVVLPGG